MPSARDLFFIRLEARWQFRRLLLLEAADLLEHDRREACWQIVNQNLQRLLSSPSHSIRKSARRWLRLAGKTPEEMVRAIRSHFAADTVEGPRRHKLQDLSDGHPFSGLWPADELEALRHKSRDAANLLTL